MLYAASGVLVEGITRRANKRATCEQARTARYDPKPVFLWEVDLHPNAHVKKATNHLSEPSTSLCAVPL